MLKINQKPTRSRRSIGKISKADFSEEEYMFEIEKAFKKISIGMKLKNIKHDE